MRPVDEKHPALKQGFTVEDLTKHPMLRLVGLTQVERAMDYQTLKAMAGGTLSRQQRRHLERKGR